MPPRFEYAQLRVEQAPQLGDSKPLIELTALAATVRIAGPARRGRPCYLSSAPLAMGAAAGGSEEHAGDFCPNTPRRRVVLDWFRLFRSERCGQVAERAKVAVD